jgi:hypothetical protein
MSSWWERKLSVETTPKKTSLPPTTQRTVLPAFTQQATTTVAQPRPVTDASGQIDMGTAIRTWSGGEAHRMDGHLTCPKCGSKNVFSRSNGGITNKPPAPRCFECGWNGIYTQADQSAWIA